jgi:dolichol-phosphate mannosyltransferase
MNAGVEPQTTSEALSLVVVARNEAENVSTVLDEVLGWLAENEPGAELIFVDDGSSDNTATLAEAALENFDGRVVRHPKNRGIGGAIKTGVLAARNPWVTFMPADGQIPPRGIAILRETAARDGSPLVLSVYEARDDGSLRKVLSWGVRMLIRTIHGVTLRCEGPYLFRREMFDAEILKPDSFFLNFEFPIRMLRAGHQVSVAEIPCRARIGGHSKTANTKTIMSVASDLVSLRFRLHDEGQESRE